MAANRRSPTVRHRRLTQMLRRLREDAAMTRADAARRMEWDPSKISRFEGGTWKRIAAHDLRGLLEVYGVTDEESQNQYVQLAKEAGRRGWWTQYADVIGNYVGFEDEASSIQVFEPQRIPGLLQTEDYARALFEGNPTIIPEGVSRRVSVRIERKKLLNSEHPPEFWAIVDEQAIRRPVGGHEVMREQLAHLVSEASTHHVTLQVLPIEAGAHPGMDGSFVMLSFPHPTDEPIVYVESATDGLYLEDEAAINGYNVMFNHLRAMALSQVASVRLIKEVAAETGATGKKEDTHG